MPPHAFEQGRFDRGRVGAAVLAAGQQDRAEPAAVRGAHAARGGIERHLRAGLDPLGEQAFDRRLLDRRGGEDSRACRGAAHLRHRQPCLARQRRGGIEPEAAPADAEPVGARGIAALREPVGKGERDAGAHFAPETWAADQARPAPREASRRFRALAFVAAPAPEPLLQIGLIAAEAPLGEQNRDLGRGGGPAMLARKDQHMGEARRQRQFGDLAAMRGRAAGRVERAERPQPFARLLDRRDGRRIEPAQRPGIGDAPER